jgi:ComF family protein
MINNPAPSRLPLLQRLGLDLLEFFLPRLCAFCGQVVERAAKTAVCQACAGQIDWVASPLCLCCGRVFVAKEALDHLCGDCQADPPPFRRARAAALYTGPAREAVRRFKYGRRLHYLPVMQAWLRQPPVLELLQAADLLVPVPLHRQRLQQRGFNQALLLAQGLPEVPLGRETLVRVRHTMPQAGLKPKERQENVHRAFTVPRPPEVEGKNLLLLDDVFTTGATVRECARVLLAAGARQVEVLTVARVK